MPTQGVVDFYGGVIYEGGIDESDNYWIDHPEDPAIDGDTSTTDPDVGEFGLSVYDNMIPTVGLPIAQMRDTDNYQGIAPTAYVMWSELDYTIGGETGMVNRNDQIINGIEPYEDWDWRGQAPHVPQRQVPGNYGDVGNTDDYSSQFAQALAATGEAQVTQEQMWADQSGAF